MTKHAVVLAMLLAGCSSASEEATTAGAALSDDTWRHVHLHRDDVNIDLDYQIVRTEHSIVAKPLWINVTKPGLSASDAVRVVFLNYYSGSSSPADPLDANITQDLEPADAGQRFTGELSRPVPLSIAEVGYGYDFRQELAVVIDGRWIKARDDENFRFELTWGD